jgi:cytochrome d ubiquinol oxidase subunit I
VAAGLIATRSVDEPVDGLKDIIARNEARIKRGVHAVQALRALQANRHDEAARAQLARYQKDLGYGLLLTRYAPDIAHATPEQIHEAALHSVPRVAPLFFTFRIMVASGFAMLLLFLMAGWSVWRNNFMHKRWLLRAALWSLPLPWLAAELGWFVAEYGRQPWTISGILPTSLSASSLTVAHVTASLIAFVLFYAGLTAVEMYLMVKYARKGPAALRAH